MATDRATDVDELARAPAREGEDPVPAPQRAAAVDLGSNSFHMVVAQLHDGELRVVDRIREQVQLGGGLGDDKVLGGDAWTRSIECLGRFGQRLRGIPPDHVRAVGTNTLRAARNRREFLAAAEDALGHPIEIISGAEEARLIYLGVSHTVGEEEGRRLVVDIGGGSTECIVGRHFEELEAHSLFMGCVSYAREYFPGGAIDAERFGQAVLAARLELHTVERQLGELGWVSAVGASGTIRAVKSVLREHGWSDGSITSQGLRKLRKHLLTKERVDALELRGLKPERAPVFPAGVAILVAIFDSLGIERMGVAGGALREGVLYDMLGRIRHEDVRERTIRWFQERFHVDRAQANRVERTALALLKKAAGNWDIDAREGGRVLAWAAALHEIGLVVSYGGYQRHSAYLIENSDMPGFSRRDQELLAAIVLNHRRKAHPESFETLPDSVRKLALRLTAIFRLAVMLNRGRDPRPHPTLGLRVGKSSVRLKFPAGWLDDHPLTRMDLARQARLIAPLGFKFKVSEE